MLFLFFFFFQAEDGIRDSSVTGVQTCALPISLPALEPETERFWRACREGRLEITRCQACGWYVHPPRPVCPRCLSRDLAWEAVSGRATVASYTVNHQRWMPAMEVPYVIGLVELVEQA